MKDSAFGWMSRCLGGARQAPYHSHSVHHAAKTVPVLLSRSKCQSSKKDGNFEYSHWPSHIHLLNNNNILFCVVQRIRVITANSSQKRHLQPVWLA